MSDAEHKFSGFAQPKENWSKLPHTLIDELGNITSESELKVILYVLRHTWGYHDTEKRITIDEFCNGRKRNDGSRIDAGCGITANSVKAGIENAVNHGYIVVEEDAQDKARIKRFYSINSGGQSLMGGGQKLTPWVSKVDPRTEKDTSERYLEKERGSVASEATEQTNTAAPLLPLKAFDKSIPTKNQPVSQNGLQPPPAEVPTSPFLVDGLTAGELAKQRAVAHKYCPEYDWKIHRAIFDFLVTLLGKQKLVDVDHDRTISDLQGAAVTLEKLGFTVDGLSDLQDAWKADWRGKKGSNVNQFVEFASEYKPKAGVGVSQAVLSFSMEV